MRNFWEKEVYLEDSEIHEEKKNKNNSAEILRRLSGIEP
jgi:hypothetical protein